MKKTLKYVRKAAAAIVGLPIIILGIILIPLPGPGLLVCLLGFFILSLEFEFAHKYLESGKKKLSDIYKASKERSERFK